MVVGLNISKIIGIEVENGHKKIEKRNRIDIACNYCWSVAKRFSKMVGNILCNSVCSNIFLQN